MAQQKDYAKEWKEIETFEQKGQPKNVLTALEKLIKLAKADKNEPELLRAVFYKIDYVAMTTEADENAAIKTLDSMAATMKSPSKNILLSAKASRLNDYFDNNRYRYYQRTELKQEKSNDITTWSLDKLHSEIKKTYLASLENEKVLKNTKVDNYDPIIVKGNVRNLRPTLYDLLAHRAVDYFKNDENSIARPAFKFILSDEKLFDAAHQFAAYNIQTKDTASNHYNALVLLQDLIRFHNMEDMDDAATADVDIERIQFVYTNSVLANKDGLYLNALREVEAGYLSTDAKARALLLQGEYYNDDKFLDDSTKRDYKIKAKQLFDAVVEKYPKSGYAALAKNHLYELNKPSIFLQQENVVQPGLPFKTIVVYQNVQQLHFRLYKIDRNQVDDFFAYNENQWKILQPLKPIKAWIQPLPPADDYLQHRVEIKMDAMEAGFYIVEGSINSSFTQKENIQTLQLIVVSNLATVYNGGKEVYVLDRTTGAAIVNAQVSALEKVYDDKRQTYVNKKLATKTTDKNGYASFDGIENYAFTFETKQGSDHLYLPEQEYVYYYNSYKEQDEKPVEPQTFFFTDRSIYRPGQTIFFKAIVLQKAKNNNESKVIAGRKTTVTLLDVNHQKIDSLELMTNGFGSIAGSFRLPEGRLNGNFYLRDFSNGAIQNFKVEEYKRPTFEVEVKAPQQTYRLNDSVTIQAKANSYSGASVGNANVVYRVIRKVRLPFWWEGGYTRGYGKTYPPYGRGEQVEITNGTTTTDAEGNFNITFKAIPDETVDKKDQPIFSYEVNADVTSINGETRSGSQAIQLSYQALQLNVDAPEKIVLDSLPKIKITSTNLNNVFEKTTVQLQIFSLEQPRKILKERYWEAPDKFVMTKLEHDQFFPNDVYANELDKNTWALGKKIIDVSDTTSPSGNFNIPKTNLESGCYKMIVGGKDRFGEPVKTERFVYISSNANATSEPIEVQKSKDQVQPGEQLTYKVLTGFDKINAIETIVRSTQKPIDQQLAISSSKPIMSSINIVEDDRGGISLNYVFVKNNRMYTHSVPVAVPYTNKQLNISFETYRDKTMPGSTEKWSVKISGDKKDKVNAEALLSMYDASLEQFVPHQWRILDELWMSENRNINWFSNNFKTRDAKVKYDFKPTNIAFDWNDYDYLLINDLWNHPRHMKIPRPVASGLKRNYAAKSAEVSVQASAPLFDDIAGNVVGEAITVTDTATVPYGSPIQKDEKNNNQNPPPTLRKNFNETAFFLPQLQTDKDGNIQFSFTMPEALTTWRLMAMAHTPALASAFAERTLITQKDLMIQANVPRFVREGDEMELSANVANLSNKEITGTAQLQLLDAATNKPVDGWFKNVFHNQYFTIAAGQSGVVKFPITIPHEFGSALVVRLVATTKDGTNTDGEEHTLPVLTNRTLVTETLPINLRNTNQKSFKFNKLLNANNSGTLTHQSLTVEFTTNPVWYVVQALPYLMEYPYECAEQNFNRYYANALAAHIVQKMPKIKAVFDQWKTLDTAALQSNLQKNQELKSALLEETPWVLAAQSEAAQKQNIAMLFNLTKLATAQDQTLAKLTDMQRGNGGFSWFKGGPDDRYITQYILAGIGHLRKLNIATAQQNEMLQNIVDKALPYLDARFADDYSKLIKSKAKLKQNNLSYIAAHYLYTRSFFPEIPVAKAGKKAMEYYTNQTKTYWLKNSKYTQAMLALAMHRSGDAKTAKLIMESLRQYGIQSEELGMYYKEYENRGWFWYQAPIETQAMIIEAFNEIEKDQATINNLKTWLLKQKQVQNWGTTKATAEACYAMLLTGADELGKEKDVAIQLGNYKINSNNGLVVTPGGKAQNAEAATGYLKTTIPGKDVQQGMGNIEVTTTGNENSTAWGAVYWQYFEDLDKITTAQTPLKLEKKLFVEKLNATGAVLEELEQNGTLKVGDKVKVRIILRVDRDMEYVHMKDMRSAAMEPVNVLSQYKWQDGLGYYESTKDASTNFFFGWLPKGTYVFEYPMFVTHEGNFSNGITTIQCMYAPEFSAHSEGLRVNVDR